jgi:hypothetical protein
VTESKAPPDDGTTVSPKEVKYEDAAATFAPVGPNWLATAEGARYWWYDPVPGMYSAAA